MMVVFGKVVHVLLWIAFLPTIIAVFEWTDYHTRGKSSFFGINPRCTHQSIDGGHCFQLDTTNLSWDATAALWLNKVLLVGMISGAVIASAAAVAYATLLVVSVAFPQDKQTGMLSRLADSPWLQLGTLGLGWVLAGVVVAILFFWAQMPMLAVLLIIPAGILSTVVSAWADVWAVRYRHERFLAREAVAERDALGTKPH